MILEVLSLNKLGWLVKVMWANVSGFSARRFQEAIRLSERAALLERDVYSHVNSSDPLAWRRIHLEVIRLISDIETFEKSYGSISISLNDLNIYCRKITNSLEFIADYADSRQSVITGDILELDSLSGSDGSREALVGDYSALLHHISYVHDGLRELAMLSEPLGFILLGRRLWNYRQGSVTR